ncbi:hypothetical protein Q9L42_000625 [Methylomarinum sp. Ch1-1]|uniref:Uncharacterized protein n=1 Tax=Methylomarinum roseum TaxID=3067653 RepID=A0AAU7NVL0_9GAMM|nr:hypothetical protein [Methylomarinum sp. Ch1-1]MDP4519256.1 hypothetical protein [Methylomarinum sp. Ch1-1]
MKLAESGMAWFAYPRISLHYIRATLLAHGSGDIDKDDWMFASTKRVDEGWI